MILVIIGASIYSINGINSQIDSYARYTLPNSTNIWVIKHNIVSIQRYIATALAENNTNQTIAQLELARQETEALQDTFESYAANQRDGANKETLAELNEFITRVDGVREEIEEAVKIPSEANILHARRIFEYKYVPAMDRAAQFLEAPAPPKKRSVSNRSEIPAPPSSSPTLYSGPLVPSLSC